ncbi:MAG: hypothetical protein COV74_09405 [Candidatus Omnitrophica bacterium CG11_big_fil_rev_8_21_14_0_20_45_26]|uniref:Uncharacterized protein n=1 Tax=Candidatus Abzuiibacterium crystallinum TaxID=1974748 RepID=A0A2H0LNP1_9BACT|nr:MAG: hypothetical protein COV74_09405 [Candidatus Omnitrophica bacterium CG11_big_fil_rev_8_21_14_0_20_45_26]PIW63560.1 MAG: hypothetical protein COW12_09950 [Candidatus Omnitrophica bacterium CG12_big_fil_rev_8_21_14_0_65_45_16]
MFFCGAGARRDYPIAPFPFEMGRHGTRQAASCPVTSYGRKLPTNHKTNINKLLVPAPSATQRWTDPSSGGHALSGAGAQNWVIVYLFLVGIKIAIWQ